MPDEKKISKVVYHLNSSDTTGTTWMDTTDKTVTTTNLFRGATALASSGQSITGTVDFNVNNTDGTKTLGSMDINSSTGEIEATFIDINVMQYYSSNDSFPAIGSSKQLYVNTTDKTLWRWTDNDGYYQVGGTDTTIYTTTTNVASISNWSAGTMTSLSVAANAPTLTITNGTAPTLASENVTVITSVSTTTPQIV